MSIDLNTSEQNITARSVLTPELVDLQKFMFSGRYNLIPSALAGVCPWMAGHMIWITSFNHCRMSLLLLMSNIFLKVRVVYFKENFTISGGFQCLACSVGAPSTCYSSTINFLGIEGPFLDEVGPSSSV